MPFYRTWSRLCFSAAAAALCLGPAHGAELSEQTLAEALEALRLEGIETVYTERLVTDALKVSELPWAPDPQERLRLLLSPFGFEARLTSQGVWAVSRSHTGVVEGCLRSDPGGQPIAGATLGISRGAEAAAVEKAQRSRSDQQGCFRFLAVPSGPHVVDVAPPGFLPRRLRVDVRRSGVHRVDASLRIDAELRDAVFVSDAAEQPPLGTWTIGAGAVEERESAARSDPDLLSALARWPGVRSTVGAALGIRGQGSDRMAVLVDGVEVVEPYHLRGLGSPASVVTPNAVDEIQLHRGQPPLVYGNRAGGILELVTTTPDRRLSVRLGATVESENGRAAGTAFDGRARWLASFRQGRPSIPPQIGEFGLRPSYWDGVAKISAALGPSRDLSVHSLLADDEFSFLQLNGLDDQQISIGQSSRHGGARFLGTFWGRHLAVVTLSDIEVSRVRRVYELNAQIAVDRADNLSIGSLRTYSLEDLRETRRRGRRLEVTSNISDRLDVFWGVESSRERSAYGYSGFNYFAPELGRSGLFERWLNEQQLGVFVQGEWRATAHLTLELGGRWDDSELSDQSGWVPRLGISFRRGEGVWRASWARVVAMARTHELLLGDGLDQFPGAETSDYLALGFLRNRSRHSLAVELFSQRIDDPRLRFFNLYKPISRIPELEVDRLRLEAASSRIQGLEFRFDGRGEGWRSGVAYQLSRAEDWLEGRWVPRQEDRRHEVMAWLHRELPRGVQLSLYWSGATGAPTTPLDVDRFQADGFEPALGVLHSNRLEDDHRLDIRLSRDFRWKGVGATVEVGVDDVYDHRPTVGFDLLNLSLGQGQGLLPERDEGRKFRWGVELSF